MSIVKKTKTRQRRRRKTSGTGGRGKGAMIPLRVSEGFRSFIVDQLDELGNVTAKSMFGGVGLYQGEVFFGIIAADVLYLKVGDTNRSDYVQAGSKPFRPYAQRSGSMHYWSVPLAVLESGHELLSWARKAVAAARDGR